MRFSVSHETCYRYSAPVRFGAHILRLTPRADHGTLVSHAFTIDPAPVTREDRLDAYGNVLTYLEFEGFADHLSIDSRFEFETQGTARPLMPSSRSVAEAATFLPSRPSDESVRSFAATLARESENNPVAFLEWLNETLFTRMDRHFRPDGAAHPPEHTLATGKGACRDLTMLFMACCHSLGMPSRFVSGYQAHAETPDKRRHLHAWAEVFLPEAGCWRGYDPMHGIPVTDGHVALCVAPDQGATMPVQGGFYGDGVTSSLSYAIEIVTTP